MTGDSPTIGGTDSEAEAPTLTRIKPRKAGASRRRAAGTCTISGELRVSLDELPEVDGRPISLGPVVMDSDPTTTWTIELYQFYANLLKACPRCTKVCPWVITRSIRPQSQIREVVLGYPACPCSQEEIHEALTEIWAEILEKEYWKIVAERQGRQT